MNYQFFTEKTWLFTLNISHNVYRKVNKVLFLPIFRWCNRLFNSVMPVLVKVFLYDYILVFYPVYKNACYKNTLRLLGLLQM